MIPFGKRDWQLVWENDKPVTHEFREPSAGDLESNLHLEYSYYKIYYSPSRRRYKLKATGYAPKSHWYYQRAIEKLRQFNSENGVQGNDTTAAEQKSNS